MSQLCYWMIPTAVGSMRAICDGDAVKSLYLVDRERYPEPLAECSRLEKTDTIKRLEEWLNLYMDGKNPRMDFCLQPEGTPFQKKIWKELTRIPYGEAVTYGEIAGRSARQENRKMSAQAVGQAVGHNHILILIPCHRVLGSKGSLTGFGAGIDVKEQLLNLEKIEFCKDRM